MSMVPEFWHNLILVVDVNKPFSLADVQSFLDWNCTSCLNIAVTRQPSSRIPSADEEKSLMTPLISLLAPYLHRCQSFHFHTIHSSSLPLLGRDLCCAASVLTRLQLESHVDNGGDSIHPDSWCSLSCLSLRVLAINGHNIINVAFYNPGWFNTISMLRFLTISCLAPRPERVGQQLSVYQFARMLSSRPILHFLQIRDVYLEHDLMS